MPAAARDRSCATLLRESTPLSAPEAVETGQRQCGAPGVRSTSGVDVVPFPTLASVEQLYQFDPELSIHKYDSSTPAIERNAPRAYPMRQSGFRRPPPGSRAARSNPV